MLGGGMGQSIKATNRQELSLGGGLAAIAEQTLSESSFEESLEAYGILTSQVFIWDGLETDLSTSLWVFPSLTETDRIRVELSSRLRQEVALDFFISLSLFYSYDSKPRAEKVQTSDIGLITSLGWTL